MQIRIRMGIGRMQWSAGVCRDRPEVDQVSGWSLGSHVILLKSNGVHEFVKGSALALPQIMAGSPVG